MTRSIPKMWRKARPNGKIIGTGGLQSGGGLFAGWDPVFGRWVIAVACLLAFAEPSPAAAAERVVITPMDVPALEAMISTSAGPMLAVAMTSWCTPCLKEIPILNKLAATYGPKGLRIVGLSVDFDSPAAMQAVADKLNVAFPLYWVGEAGAETLKITSVPMAFVIRGGTVTERLFGLRSQAELEKKIRQLLD